MKLPKSFTTVTTFSKTLALFILIVFPITGFWLGRYYQANAPVVTQTPDPTRWNVYTNTTYGYSIKYPSNFNAEYQYSGMNKPQQSTENSTSVYIGKTYPEAYLKIQNLLVRPVYSNEVITTNLVIGGHKALKFSGNPLFDIYDVDLTDNKYFLEISVSKDTAKKDLANQILSTFKFTK